MHLERFRSPDGTEITDRVVVDDASERDATCSIDDFGIAASSLRAAIEEGDDLIFYQVPLYCESAYHQILVGGQNLCIGIFDISQETLPTVLEVAACKHLLYADALAPNVREIKLGFSSRNLEGVTRDVAKAAMECRSLSAFHRYAQSTFSNTGNPYGSLTARFLSQSYENSGTKYAFLEAYRALEATFLHVILDEVNRKFFRDPRGTLEHALSSISKERSQLASMICNLGLDPHLNKIASEVDLLTKSRPANEFAVALAAAIKVDKSQPPREVKEQAWRGAWFIYQIRCSIAHAGTSGIVFEDYDDALALTAKIQPYTEEIALNITGFKF